MSASRTTVHLRAVARDVVVRALERRMQRRGFERVGQPSVREPVLVRLRVVAESGWVSFTGEGMDDDVVGWAEQITRALKVEGVAAWSWEDEAVVELTHVTAGKAAAKLSIPRGARRAPDGRVAIPLGTLSRFVPSAGTREVELLVRSEEAMFEEEACVHVPEADSTHALARALRIRELFVDPHDDEDPSEIVIFRPKAGSAEAAREVAESELRMRRLREDHDGRMHVVGWLAFDAAPKEIAGLLGRTAAPLVASLAPAIRPRVLHARAIVPGQSERVLPDPNPAGAWKSVAKALATGALVAIEHREQPIVASAWAMFREGALVIGWCMRGLKDEARRTALAARMHDVFTTSTDDARCFGAVITCQQSPLRLEQQALAYELLRRTSIFANHPEAYRARVRSPGWRVLVPSAAAPLAGALPAGVLRRASKAGVVLEVDLADPHALAPAEMDALEAHLGAALGQSKPAR